MDANRFPRAWHNAHVSDLSILIRGGGDRNVLHSERLDRLRFQDALDDCIALSELAMDMVEAFSSREELIWIQNRFKPARKTPRAKPQPQRRS